MSLNGNHIIEVSNLIVTVNPSPDAPGTVQHVRLGDVLARFRSPKPEVRALIEQIRATEDKAARDVLKKQLPVVIFGGRFTYRNEKGIRSYSGLACIDLDAQDNPGKDLVALKELLARDGYVLAVFTSVSGRGLKLLVRLSDPVDPVPDADTLKKAHRAGFEAFRSYLRDVYGIVADHTPDLSRGCYVTWDPDLRVNQDARLFPFRHVPEPAVRPSGDGVVDLELVESALEAIPLGPNFPYHDWLRIGLALAGTLGVEEAVRLMLAYGGGHPGDTPEYLERTFKGARGEIGLGTVFWYAQQYGWRPSWKRREQVRVRDERAKQPEPERARVVRVADVEPERVRWLWRGRLALGKLTLLEGDPGTGKSTLYAEIAAIISRGRPFPDQAETPVEPGNVLIVTCEDGVADTIRPRLDAAGADLRRVFALREVQGADGPRAPMLPQDAALIEQAVRDVGACLLIVDPLSAHVDASVNMYRDQDVRRVLTILAGIAERCDCAVLAIRHLNKAVGLDPIYRGGGSVGIIGQARFAFLLANHPEQPEDAGVRVLAPVKTNIGRPAPSLVFRIESWDKDPDTARIRWEGTTTLKARDLLRPPRETKQDEAAEWLREQLAGGARPAREIFEAAQTIGFSEKTIRRAQRALGVVVERRGEDGRRGGGTWWWRLPGNNDLEDYLDGQILRVDHLNPNGAQNPSKRAKNEDCARDLDGQLNAGHLNTGHLNPMLARPFEMQSPGPGDGPGGSGSDGPPVASVAPAGDIETLRRRVLKLAEVAGWPSLWIEGLRLEPSERAWRKAVQVWTEFGLQQALELLSSIQENGAPF